MAEPVLSGATRRLLKEALFAAFPTQAALAQMLKERMNVSLAEWASQSGTLTDQIFEVIEQAEAKGRLEELVKGASAATPGNPRLREAAQKLLGGGVTRVRQQFAPEAFDLQNQEQAWARALALLPVGAKRLLILVLRDADDYVRRAIAQRLERRLTDDMAPYQQTVTLSPTINNTAEVVQRVCRLKAIAQERHVLCTVVATAAQADVVGRFFEDLRQPLAGPFRRHLVMLTTVSSGAVLPGDATEIPTPVFEEWQLNEWVETVTQGSGWPIDLVQEFAAAVLRDAKYGDTLEVGRVYDVVARAIELLSGDHDVESLRERIRSGL
jgi:hypothetical protein